MLAIIPKRKLMYSRNIIPAALLFLYCMGIYSIAIGLMLSVYAYLYLFKNKFKISLSSVVLISFLATYSVISYVHEIVTISTAIMYTVFPTALYFMGEYVIKKEDRNNLSFFYVYLVLLSFFLVGIYSMLMTAYYGGLSGLFLSVRLVYMPGSDIWINATNIGAYFTMGLSLLAYIITPEVDNRRSSLKLVSILILGLSAASMLTLGNRTGLVIGIVSFLVGYFVSMFYSGKKISSNIKTNLILMLVIFAVILIVQYFALGEMLIDSTLFQRFLNQNFYEDPRFETWMVTFLGLFEHPLGGKEIDIRLNYAHNLWLDVGYVAGVIPFILLLVFTWLSLKNLLRLIKSRMTPIGLKTFFASVYVALLLNFFVEPVMEGLFVHFTMFCFIAGLTEKYLRLSCKEERFD